jgi:calcineurin-like phosphoesterase family protein
MEWLNEDTWIISDTHLFHENIIKYASRPAHHNTIIINNWYTTVKPDDTILHLGDVILSSAYRMKDTARFLTGNKYLIKGNHDSRRKMRNHMGFNIVDRKQKRYNGNTYHFVPALEYGVIFSHQPLPLEWLKKWHVVNIHGHIHNLDTLDNRHINMSVEVRNYMPWRFGKVLEEIHSKIDPNTLVSAQISKQKSGSQD